MYFSKTAVLALISVASAANHNILVGQNGGLTFSPQTVTAAVGDTVTYTFLTQNHTVTSGTSAQGCTPDGTFNSGFVPATAPSAVPSASAAAKPKTKGNVFVPRGSNNVFDARQNTAPNFVVKVTSTKPQVFYCAQAQHCQVGMVGVINPTTSGATSLSAYQQLSAKATTNKPPITGNGVGGTLNAAAKQLQTKNK